MRLSFQDGYAYTPGTYNPGLYYRGKNSLGDINYADEYAQATQGFDPNAGYSTSNLVGGAVTGAMQGAGYASAIGGGKTGPLVGAAIAGTSLAATIMMFSAAAGPFAPFVALAGGLIGPIASMFKGCGATCTQATKIADDSQKAAEQIFARWNAEPVKYYSIQQAALAAMEDIWRYLSGACSSATLGAAGQRCVSERQRGGKYDFFVHYVDPIANDPNIVPDPVDESSVAGIVGNIKGLFSGIPMPLLLGGAGVIALLVMSSGSSGASK